MNKMQEINSSPNDVGLWAGLGGHFDSFSPVIYEIVDNGIASITGNKTTRREVIITLHELVEDGAVEVTVEDSGGGMLDLDAAFSLGDQSGANWTLNEHGFGLKHALASVDRPNSSWAVYTRTEADLLAGEMKVIRAPYTLTGLFSTTCPTRDWIGEMNGTGTVIRFVTTGEMFRTLSKDVSGGSLDFWELADVLCEDISFTYSGMIQQKRVNFTLVVQDAGGAVRRLEGLEPLQPDWVAYDIGPGRGTERCMLGGKRVKLQYTFGSIQGKKPRKLFDNQTARKYYKKNMSSAGVEIRLNGRVLEHRLFTEIWGVERHNSHNHTLIIVDIQSNNPKKLLATRASKNGFRGGEKKLEELYQWIRACVSTPKKRTKKLRREVDVFRDLKAYCESKDKSRSKVIEREKLVYGGTGSEKEGVRADLYYKKGDQIEVYEGKLGATKGLDVYQLVMYWDGLVYDGVVPTKGILVGKYHSEVVRKILNNVNQMRDHNGNRYALTLKTWDELLPKPVESESEKKV